MIAWEAFNYQGVEYDLTHLHPCRLQYIQSAKSGQPERTYTVEVCYSLHCFSKTLSTAADPHLNYSDARETRTFDLERYKLSKQLPQIIQDLSSKRCMHTGKGNFFVVEVVTSSGAKEDYEVYFDVQNSSAKGVIARLFVQSAGNYLLWLDCRDMKRDDQQLKRFFVEKAGVGLIPGILFGEQGSGFMRMNIAAPRSLIRQALEQIAQADQARK
jgi:hypothetical protein